ncbi:hypothetical protein UFOVP599_43 [uncultured Caudovirales phage]|jgi:hypothetical protein|uniref:Uncharacterized protein n=1 Tax=uncultured Caudovirales phage TaxID=2100421 RepID=A0A6J5N3T3_9CAUD|nr:hypothetical protein UFOVP599_43 [uncultured Caudovirales phage]
MSEIDLVRYGALYQKVENYEEKFDAMQKKMDKMEANLEQLIALANQGRGGFWMGMLVVSGLSTLTGWFLHWFTGK